MEIARKLAREMDEHRVQSLSRTYVPNSTRSGPRPTSRAVLRLRGRAAHGIGVPARHARRERVALLLTPEITFKTDERLRLGEFGIKARLVRPQEDRPSAPQQAEEGHTMVYSSSDRLSEPLREPDPRRAAPRGCGSAGRRSCSAPAAQRSAGRAGRTSCSTTPTCRASTPRYARRAESWIVRDLRLDQRREGQRPPGRSQPAAVDQVGRRHRARDVARDLRAGVRPRARSGRRRAEVPGSSRSCICSCSGWPARRSRTSAAARTTGSSPTARADYADATGLHAAEGTAEAVGAEKLRVGSGAGLDRRRLRPLRRGRARARRPGRHRARGLVRLLAPCSSSAQ